MSFRIGLLFIGLLGISLAAKIGLAHDEAYYWMFSKHLDFGFFDHPPMVAIFIKLTGWIQKSELFVRLSFVISLITGIFFLKKLIHPKNQFLLILLYIASPMLLGSGIVALPDGCLIFFTILYLYFLKDYFEKEEKRSLIILPVIIAALLYSKYHGVLLIFFTFVANPSLIRKKSFWIITIFSVLLMIPHLNWQINHDFITFKYHFLMRPKSSLSFSKFFEFIGVQIFAPALFLGPFLWFYLLKNKAQSPFEKVLKVNAVGIVGFFFISIFSKKFEANWTIMLPIYLILFFLQKEIILSRALKYILVVSSFVVIISFICIPLLMRGEVKIARLKEFKYWENWPSKVALEMHNCSNVLMANTYQIASKLNFYGDFDPPVMALNIHSRPNQYDIWLKGNPIPERGCFLTNNTKASGLKIGTPEGKKLILMRDVLFRDILSQKEVQ